MKPNEVELWAMRVIDSVLAGNPYEDARIELKSQLPEPEKAARRIAGHANSAFAGGILWLVGVNEERGVVGAKPEELAEWWPKVESCFDGVSPDLTDVVHHYEDRLVLCLYFKTDRAPYLVKNKGGGEIQREVPWRDGTRLRTAKREDLLKLLSPIVLRPETEIVSAHLAFDRSDNTCRGGIRVFVTIPENLRMTIPLHKCSGCVIHEEEEVVKFHFFRGLHSGEFGGVGDQVRLEGPSVLHLQFEGKSAGSNWRNYNEIELTLSLGYAFGIAPISLTQRLLLDTGSNGYFSYGSW